jgi:hypothetical protein
MNEINDQRHSSESSIIKLTSILNISEKEWMLRSMFFQDLLQKFGINILNDLIKKSEEKNLDYKNHSMTCFIDGIIIGRIIEARAKLVLYKKEDLGGI